MKIIISYIIPILLLVFIIIAISYSFDNIEHFEASDSDISITQTKNTNFELDSYSFEQNGKTIIKSGGTWNLDEKKPFITFNGQKIAILDKNNIYTFQSQYNVKITVSSNCADIVINNYTDEIKMCRLANGNYEVKRNATILATINLTSEQRKSNQYTLTIKSNPQYLEIYAIAFIILSQIDKEMNISLDTAFSS